MSCFLLWFCPVPRFEKHGLVIVTCHGKEVGTKHEKSNRELRDPWFQGEHLQWAPCTSKKCLQHQNRHCGRAERCILDVVCEHFQICFLFTCREKNTVVRWQNALGRNCQENPFAQAWLWCPAAIWDYLKWVSLERAGSLLYCRQLKPGPIWLFKKLQRIKQRSL